MSYELSVYGLAAIGSGLAAFLSLALLEAGILFVNHIQLALTTYNFTVDAALFDGCSYFHFSFALSVEPGALSLFSLPIALGYLFIPEIDSSPA